MKVDRTRWRHSEGACEGQRRENIDKLVVALTFVGGLLYLAAAGMTALATAAANEETADENAYESLACVRTPRPTHPPRPISLARQTQLLT